MSPERLMYEAGHTHVLIECRGTKSRYRVSMTTNASSYIDNHLTRKYLTFIPRTSILGTNLDKSTTLKTTCRKASDPHLIPLEAGLLKDGRATEGRPEITDDMDDH